MAERQVRITLRDKQTTGGSVPGTALFGEPFVNLYDGILKFSGVTGGGFETSSQSGVFEVGSTLYNQKISNRLSVNNNFIISGDTGFISTYGGASESGLVGKFLSGTTSGFVLGNISDIQGVTTRVQPGVNIYTGGTSDNPTINLSDSPSVNNLTFSGTATGGNLYGTSISAATIYSGSTNLYNIFLTSAQLSGSSVSQGSNIVVQQTGSDYKVSVVDSPSLNNLNYSGTTTGPALSATTMSGSTLRLSSSAFVGSTSAIQWGDNGMAGSINGFLSMSSNGVFRFGDSAGGGSPRIIMGSAGPTTGISLKRNGTSLDLRLGDDSGFASLNADAIVGTSLSATTISGDTLYSGATNLYDIFVDSVNAGSNITIGGTASNPTINVSSSPIFAGLVSATGFTDSSLTSGRVVYAGASGRLLDEAGFTYDQSTDTLNAIRATFGVAGQTGTTLTVNGDLLILGEAISGFTSQLYIEDNFIELNYNPTASTESTSLGAGWSIQDGSGVAGTDVFLDIRGASTGVANRGFATNLNDIYLRESGTVSSPNGVRVLAEYDTLDGGSY
jgi:hypothetical protein